MSSYILQQKARSIQAIVLDVDGVLSDGSITLTNQGDELKSFDIQDGFGLQLVKKIGIKVAIITGRKSQIVAQRMHDLGIDLVYQGRSDKGAALLEVCEQLQLSPDECLYMGDDWIDLSAFAIAGLRVSVPNGHIEVRKRADLVTQARGGQGAVREMCDFILHAKDAYHTVLLEYCKAPLKYSQAH